MKNSVYEQTYEGLQIKADCRIHEVTTRLIASQNGKAHRLLDIACGEGALSQRIKDQCPDLEIDVNDIDQHQIKFTGYHQKFNVDLNGPIHFPNRYDLITAIEILEHVDNPQNLLTSMKNHLNDGGKIVISTPEIDSIFDRFYFLLRGRFLYFTDHHYQESGHMMPVARWQLEIFCRRAGLKLLQTIPVKWHMKKLSKLFRTLPFVPLLPFMQNVHQTSINIFVLEKEV